MWCEPKTSLDTGRCRQTAEFFPQHTLAEIMQFFALQAVLSRDSCGSRNHHWWTCSSFPELTLPLPTSGRCGIDLRVDCIYSCSHSDFCSSFFHLEGRYSRSNKDVWLCVTIKFPFTKRSQRTGPDYIIIQHLEFRKKKKSIILTWLYINLFGWKVPHFT